MTLVSVSPSHSLIVSQRRVYMYLSVRVSEGGATHARKNSILVFVCFVYFERVKDWEQT